MPVMYTHEDMDFLSHFYNLRLFAVLSWFSVLSVAGRTMAVRWSVSLQMLAKYVKI